MNVRHCRYALMMTMILAMGWTDRAWAQPKLQLAPPLGEHMVLQSGVTFDVRGKAAPGSSVTVSLAGQETTVKAGPMGSWSAPFHPLEAGGPYEMKVQSGESIEFKDVMAGEVWLASGQSNMEFQLKNEKHAAEELPKATDNSIRFFIMEKAVGLKPLDDVKGKWQVCESSVAGDFSAIAYYFAKRLSIEKKVPVGVIQNAWGGSAAESWMPLKSLGTDPVLKPILDRWMRLSEEERRAVLEGIDYDVEFGEMRFKPREDGANTLKVPLEGWSPSVKPDSTGELAEGKGTVEGGKTLRFKGNLKTGAWGSVAVNFPSPYDLTAYDALLFQAKGKGKFSIGFAQPSITDWDYYSSEAFQADPEWKDYRVPLASVKQGGWGQPKPFTPGAVSGSRVNILAPYMPEGPALMYNALIAPVAGTRIRGVLWYQGETNAGRAAQYRKLLPALIESWRGAFQDPELPFYAVQLAGFMARRDEPGDSEWAELREAQAGVLEVKGTGLATAIDLGAADDIHPKEKKEVAGRLYRWAWRDLYGGTLDPSGPTFRSMEVKGSRAVLTFDHATGGLLAKGGKLKGFAVAGKDKRFVWAKAKIKGNTVTVEENGVEEPVAVRYGWADNPECNLYNKEGLPALPFRTDDWPGLTDNRN